MTLLITGGAGFIGTRVLDLWDHDERVVVFDNLHSQVHGPDATPIDYPDSVTFFQGDVTRPDDWDLLLQAHRPRVILHLAAETGTGQSLTHATRHSNVNVTGTAMMMDALTRASVFPEQIVLTSSRAVYGEGLWRNVVTGTHFYGLPRVAEDLEAGRWTPRGSAGDASEPLPHDARVVEPRPSNVYAATKLAQENLLSAWCTSFHVGLTIFRLQNVYGAGQALNNPYTGVLTAFARSLLEDRPVQIFEGGGIVRDFVHVRDVASALIAGLQSREEGQATAPIDIGSGEPMSLFAAAEVMARIAGGSVTTTSEYRLGDVRAASADNSAAFSALGYSPRVDFESGARELLDWASKEIQGHG